jgi:hypothetical protein
MTEPDSTLCNLQYDEHYRRSDKGAGYVKITLVRWMRHY